MGQMIWARENVVGKGFLMSTKRGRGVTVAVASGVATWLHCGRSPSGIQGQHTQEDGWSPSQSLMLQPKRKHFCQWICIYAQIEARPRAEWKSLVMLRHDEVGCIVYLTNFGRRFSLVSYRANSASVKLLKLLRIPKGLPGFISDLTPLHVLQLLNNGNVRLVEHIWYASPVRCTWNSRNFGCDQNF